MIKKEVRVLFYSFFPVVAAISCSNQASQDKAAAQAPAPKADTTKKPAPAPPKVVKPANPDTVTLNRKYNDIARYIAGLKQLDGSTLPATLEKDTVWIRYSKNFSWEWAQTDKVRLKPMADFATTELAAQRKMNL